MKKTLLLLLSFALVAAVSVGGTLAYLSAADSDINVMNLGNVAIEQMEQQRVDDDTRQHQLEPFAQGKPLLPSHYSGTSIPWAPEDQWVIPGDQAWKVVADTDNVIDKFVTVKNNGSYGAYVRTIFAIEVGPNATNEAYMHIVTNGTNITDGDTWEWAWITDDAGNTAVVTIGETDYYLYVATYTGELAPGATTIPSLKQIYLDKTATNEVVNAYGSSYDILVFSQAVQTNMNGLTGGAALDSAFGNITEQNHPWAERTPVAEATDSAELADAVTNGAETIVLSKGTYTLPASKNNSFTLVGAGAGTVIDLSKATGQNLSGSNITFSNLTVKGTTKTYTGVQHAGRLVYNNVVFDNATTLYGESVTFNNCTFNLTTQYLWTYSAGEVTFNNCLFNTDGKAILIYAEGGVKDQTVNVKDCTFNATQTAHTGAGDACAAVEIDSSLISGKYTVNFTGTNTVSSNFAGLYRVKKDQTPSNVIINRENP